MKKKKLPKYQFAGTNPCGIGTKWDDALKQCVPMNEQDYMWGIPNESFPKPSGIDNPIPISTNVEPAKTVPQGAKTDETGKVIPGTIRPMKMDESGNAVQTTNDRVDSRGRKIPYELAIGDALDKGFNLDSDNVYRKTEITEDPNNLEYSSFFKGLNTLMDITQFFAGNINDDKVKRAEREKIAKARYPKADYNIYETGVNNIPIYFKTGGTLSAKKARQILHDGTVHGKPITEKQRKYFGAVASGYIKAQGGELQNPNSVQFPYIQNYLNKMNQEYKDWYSVDRGKDDGYDSFNYQYLQPKSPMITRTIPTWEIRPTNSPDDVFYLEGEELDKRTKKKIQEGKLTGKFIKDYTTTSRDTSMDELNADLTRYLQSRNKPKQSYGGFIPAEKMQELLYDKIISEKTFPERQKKLFGKVINNTTAYDKKPSSKYKFQTGGWLDEYDNFFFDEKTNEALKDISEYKNGGTHGGLDRWFAEKWVDIKTGKECGRQKGETRKGYPACRPSKRISSDTPKTSSELSSSEKAKFKKEKKSSKRISYQHKRKEYGGMISNDELDNVYFMKSGGNVPTNPSLWSRAKSAAKAKYDVYPSAYANGYAAKWYKERGGGWKKGKTGGDFVENLPKAQVGKILSPITPQNFSDFFDILSIPQKAVTKLITGTYQKPSEAMNIKNPIGATATDIILDPINLLALTGVTDNIVTKLKWKPNPTSAYRMIGTEEGLVDATKSGVLKPSTKGSDIGKVHTTTHYQMGVPSDKRKYFGRIWGRGYEGPYMAEVPNAATDVRFAQGPGGKEIGADVWTYPDAHIPTSEANLYKQHWFKGYKKVPKKEEGGIIQDNMGYWNPDNWGKVVEIDSPNITMKPHPITGQEVPPLIGISDEGDVQYMEPGKDYKFEGSKVREIPIAQTGRTLPPIYTDDPRKVRAYQDSLNLYRVGEAEQFYNNPDIKTFRKYSDVSGVGRFKSGGWLDEYNDNVESFQIGGKKNLTPEQQEAIDKLQGAYDEQRANTLSWLEGRKKNPRFAQIASDLIQDVNQTPEQAPYEFMDINRLLRNDAIASYSPSKNLSRTERKNYPFGKIVMADPNIPYRGKEGTSEQQFEYAHSPFALGHEATHLFLNTLPKKMEDFTDQEGNKVMSNLSDKFLPFKIIKDKFFEQNPRAGMNEYMNLVDQYNWATDKDELVEILYDIRKKFKDELDPSKDTTQKQWEDIYDKVKSEAKELRKKAEKTGNYADPDLNRIEQMMKYFNIIQKPYWNYMNNNIVKNKNILENSKPIAKTGGWLDSL